MTEYSAKSAAVRAARKALGAEAQPGTDFILTEKGESWTWEPMPVQSPGEPPKEKAGRAPEANSAAPQPPVQTQGEALKAAPKPKAHEKAIASGPVKELPRMPKKHREAHEAALAGNLPEAPDFSADTHKPYRKKLEDLKAMVEAGDIAGLKAERINPISTSRKALDRYRNLAVIALEAKAGEPAL